MAVLTVGVASSALFDLTASDRVFTEEGLEAYRRYQDSHLEVPLEPGPAQPFVRRLLALNDVVEDAVDVIVLSRNSAETGLRVMRSVAAAGLPIHRAVFRDGLSSYDFMPALQMSLFLSANPNDVARAVAAGHPAGTVLGGTEPDTDDAGLRVAFDFDGVLADDSSERVYRTGGLPEFSRREQELAQEPLQPGPLTGFLKSLNEIQAAESRAAGDDPQYQPRLRVCLVTARSAPAHERAVTSLRAWGLRVDDAFFLGGLPKAPVLEVLRPHVFFDDQTQHLTGLRHTPSVHVPFGVANLS
ncbi:MAG: 5'-nucleotidase [Actinomycetia bacterium]|nr:5'-nucleotidase [Actinomycetes bacterium]